MDAASPEPAAPRRSIQGDPTAALPDDTQHRSQVDAAAARAEWELSTRDEWLGDYDEVE